MTTLITPQDFTLTTTKLRTFFNDLGFLEVHTQNRLSILAACEDTRETGHGWIEALRATRRWDVYATGFDATNPSH